MSSWTHNITKKFEPKGEKVMGKENKNGIDPATEDQKKRLDEMTPEELEALRQEIMDEKDAHDAANERWKAFVLRKDNPLGLSRIQIWKIQHEVATRRLKTAGKVIAGAAATAIGWCLGSKHQESVDSAEVQQAIDNGVLVYTDTEALDAPVDDVTDVE